MFLALLPVISVIIATLFFIRMISFDQNSISERLLIKGPHLFPLRHDSCCPPAQQPLKFLGVRFDLCLTPPLSLAVLMKVYNIHPPNVRKNATFQPHKPDTTYCPFPIIDDPAGFATLAVDNDGVIVANHLISSTV
jgi:hypothetical protein